MAVSEGSVRRIVDYLNDGEELGIEGPVATPPRSPLATRLSLPRFRWPRLTKLGSKERGAKEKMVVLVEEEAEVVADKGEPGPVPVSTSVEQAAVARTCEPASTSGAARRPDVGMALSLVLMLAKTSSEFNKMVQVRTEVEALLTQVKHLQAREATGGNGHDDNTMPEPPGNRESTTSSCVTDRNDRGARSPRLEERAVSSGVNADMSSSEDDDDECYTREDGLEEEFHAKMERLQCTYGSDIPLYVAEEERDSELSDDINDYGHKDDDDDELGEVVEDDEDGIDDDDDDDYSGGVSAVELERRLHELLHQRNLERIQELEAALRRAEKKLAEKEMEVCLWKDTAKFALRRENELQ